MVWWRDPSNLWRLFGYTGRITWGDPGPPPGGCPPHRGVGGSLLYNTIPHQQITSQNIYRTSPNHAKPVFTAPKTRASLLTSRPRGTRGSHSSRLRVPTNPPLHTNQGSVKVLTRLSPYRAHPRRIHQRNSWVSTASGNYPSPCIFLRCLIPTPTNVKTVYFGVPACQTGVYCDILHAVGSKGGHAVILLTMILCLTDGQHAECRRSFQYVETTQRCRELGKAMDAYVAETTTDSRITVRFTPLCQTGMDG